MAIALKTNEWVSPFAQTYYDKKNEMSLLKPQPRLIKSRIMKRRGISTSNGNRKRHGSKDKKESDLTKVSSTNPMSLSLSTRYIHEKNNSQKRFYEWRKYQLKKKKLDFQKQDRLEDRLNELNRLHRFIYSGVDDAVMISTKTQSILDKKMHSSKYSLFVREKSYKEKKKDKQSKKNKNEFEEYVHKTEDEYILDLPIPPYYYYIPKRCELQLVIKKALQFKTAEEILYNI